MSLLDNPDGKSWIEEDDERSEWLFQFPQTEPDKPVQTAEEIADEIHGNLGLYLKPPAIFEPDDLRREFKQVFPEGFELDPDKVKEVRVRHYDGEVDFFVVPYPEVNVNPFRFRITQYLSEHNLIPDMLLKPKESEKMAA